MTASAPIFPTATDLTNLEKKSDGEILAIWRSLMTPSCGCALHTSDAAVPVSDEWAEAVQTELIRRGLPEHVSPPDNGELACPTCSADCATACPPSGGPDVYLVCRPCSTMRRLGDHMNCRLGPVEPLPTDW